MSADALTHHAGLLAERSRAAICLALLDGRAWTATELARHAGVSLATASEHLTLLVRGGLLAERRQGRHRYLRLAGPQAAQLVEDLAVLSGPPRPVGLRQVRANARLAAGRTCYDHLAGDLGVAVRESLVSHQLLAGGGLTDAGRAWFSELLGPPCLRTSGRRPVVRECLDWTRRVPHLGGALGAAFCQHLFDNAWLLRPARDRAVVLTHAGKDALAALLGI